MEDVISVIYEAVKYIPNELLNVGIIAYLIWFQRVHTRAHNEIMKRLKDSEDIDKKYSEDSVELRKLLLKSLIMQETLPVMVRMEMYDEYKKIGGNSWVEDYVTSHILNKIQGRRFDDKK